MEKMEVSWEFVREETLEENAEIITRPASHPLTPKRTERL